ncbi:MAG: NAD(P)-binding domain-containing protein, partial [Rhodospirillales bacterium]|nr:NAD(P)-binding domain-containing protein [Rhodospirillales bacterium]
MSTDFKKLKLSFEDKSAKIGVIGLGHVGLPLCLTFAEKGFQTLGFDIDKIKIISLENGSSYISHIDSADISSFISSGQFTPTIDFARLSKMDAVLICVPTPLDKNREPDLSYVVSTGEKIVPHLRSNQLVVLESTTYPGT